MDLEEEARVLQILLTLKEIEEILAYLMKILIVTTDACVASLSVYVQRAGGIKVCRPCVVVFCVFRTDFGVRRFLWDLP